MVSKTNFEAFARFILERHSIWVRRNQGLPKPWSKDPIFQNYRFCNVYREMDVVTMWIRDNWRTMYAEHPHAWFAMVVARLVNKPSTLNVLDPLPWNPRMFVHRIEGIQNGGGQAFSSAYMVTTHGHSIPKAQFMAQHVLEPLWEDRATIYAALSEPDVTLSYAHHVLNQYTGLGSFLAAQVVADLKHMKKQPLYKAPDWWDWAAPGPGSMRGMNRLLGRGPSRSGLTQTQWLCGVNELRLRMAPTLIRHGYPALCAQDMQNCLCEFDKYERIRLGEGVPKQRFNGGAPC